MMTTQKIDSERARDAFAYLQPRLDQQTELRRATVDAEKAAAQAAAVGRMVQQAEVREMFEQLSPRVFNMQHVDELEQAALATWHTVVERRDAAVHASEARIPADLNEESGELKQRMLRVVEYHLRGDIQVAVIADIRAGQGHADRASDLLRLGKLYEANADILARDQVYYRPEDAARANELAHRIYAQLGESSRSDERYWAEYMQRAWTYLVNTYDEVSAAGRWLYRHDNGDKRFPSLFMQQRKPSGRAGKGPIEPAAPLLADNAPAANISAQVS